MHQLIRSLNSLFQLHLNEIDVSKVHAKVSFSLENFPLHIAILHTTHSSPRPLLAIATSLSEPFADLSVLPASLQHRQPFAHVAHLSRPANLICTPSLKKGRHTSHYSTSATSNQTCNPTLLRPGYQSQFGTHVYARTCRCNARSLVSSH